MARPPSLALGDASTQGDHSDWQVVLSDPSKRRVVLYSRNLNRLSIEPTPPPSPSLTGSTRRRRGWRRRSWSGLSSLEGSSEGEGGGAAGAPPESTSSPLARAAAAAVRKHGRDTDDDDEDDEDGQQRSGGGGRPSSRQHSLTDAVPESVCPLCFQILPPPPQPLPLSSSSAPPTTTGSASPATNSGRSRNLKQKRTRHKRLFPLLPPPAGFLAAAAADHHHQSSDPGTESDRTTAAESRSSHAVVAGDMNAGTSYFELLSEANSLVNTPMSTGGSGGNARIAPAAAESPDHRGKAKDEGLDSHQMNEGYYARFFDEVSLLGRGGQGAVYLVRHMLNGEALGLYACKKVPVGDSTPSLLSILREVHMLESASHPNIIAYHHAWLETAAPTQSRFVPKVPTLHILMECANGGSLQGFVDARKGSPTAASEGGGGEGGEEMDGHGAARAARRRRKEARGQAVHLLRLDDILNLFEEVVRGLAFLHGRNILHLDLKAENVLLHWEENSLLPTCKLSDFGSASSDSYHRERIGGSGTLAYTPPEALCPSPTTGHYPPPDRATDMWALGLIVHLLVFFALPFAEAGPDGDTKKLEEEIKLYRGFQATNPLPRAASARHDLPPSLLQLLSQLIHHDPSRRPSCDRVLSILRLIRQDVARGLHAEPGVGTVVRANPTAGAVWSRQRFGPQRPRRSLSDSSIQPMESRNASRETLQAEVVEVDSSEEGGLHDDDEEGEIIDEGEDPFAGTDHEQQLLIHQRRALLATQVPTSSLPQVLSISPPGRALPSPPLLGDDAPPFLALPSPTEIAGNEMGPDGFGNDCGDVRKSLRALPWRQKPVHLWDRVLRDSRVRPATVAALAAVAKLMHYTFVKRFGRSEPWPLGASLPRSSSTSVPLWMAILLLTETVLDVALARTYCSKRHYTYYLGPCRLCSPSSTYPSRAFSTLDRSETYPFHVEPFVAVHLSMEPTRQWKVSYSAGDLSKAEETISRVTPASSTAPLQPVLQQCRRNPVGFLRSNIDTDATLWQLVLYCFLTGFTTAPTFLACYIWCGFQSGGLVQLSLAVARLFATSDHTFYKGDQQALASLLSFLVGVSIGRIGDHVGVKKRWWLMTATSMMGLMTLAATLCAHFSGEPSIAEYRTEASWQYAKGMAALCFASAALGLQGVVSRRLNSQFGTAVVLTSTWVELFSDPRLFAPQLVKSRDHRTLAIFATFLGGMCSTAVVYATNSSAVALGITTGLRLVSVLSWLLVPVERDDSQ
ncbi:hypothetical protein JCM8115_001030 [Rhodotorula mucilaginosa]